MFTTSAKFSNLFIIYSLALLIILNDPAEGKPKPAPNNDATQDMINNKFGSIFKVGPGMMMFNTGPTNTDDDEIICVERSTGKSYCTEVQNYTLTAQLDQIDSEQFEQFKSYFQNDLVVQSQNVASRMHDGAERHKCNSKSRIIYPKGVEGKDSKWLLVVQHEQHKQGVLVEECDGEELSHCKYDSPLPLALSAKCKQRFVYRSMVVLVKGVLKERMVKLPSSCECALCQDIATL